jgi:arginyl-tRNA synthetase
VRKYAKPVLENFSTELDQPEERELMRLLLHFEDTLQNSFTHFKPHFLAGYLLDVCRKFSQFYTKCRVLGAKTDDELKTESSRMTLVQATHRVLEQGLKVLGVEIPDAM